MASSSTNLNPTIIPSSTDETVPIPTPVSKRRADVWAEFTEVLVDGVKKARCNHCSKFLAIGSNSTLRRHFSNCPQRVATKESDQSQIDSTGHNWIYNQATQREHQAQLVIQKELPFNFFDDPRVTNYINRDLQPKYKQVSRTTTRRDSLKLYLNSKKELIAYFSNFDGRVSLTSDAWKSKFNLGVSYICLTAHWIDSSSWTMHKRIIGFELFEYPHSGQGIYTTLMKIIREFKLKDKIMSISFDNATNNTSAIGMLKRDLNPILNDAFFHCRCVCHVMNLIVQSGLEFINHVIEKIRYMLTFIYSSSKRRQDFKHFCHGQNEKFIKPVFDVEHRWNSTYGMLKHAFKRKTLLMDFYSQVVPHDITHEDWDNVQTLLRILKPFYKATKCLGGVYYPTTPKVIVEFFNITAIFDAYRNDVFWSPLIYSMQEKFYKYYEEMPPVYTCAAVLNPLIKVEGVENLIEYIEKYLGINDSSASIQNFNKSFQDFYTYYDLTYGKSHETNVIPSSSSSKIPPFLEALSKKKARTSNSSLNELGLYGQNNFASLLSEADLADLDLLTWWRNNGRNYPVLAAMARDILTVQASTVASESCFSLAGRVLDEKRSRLNPLSLEICICYKDYLDAMNRVQDKVLSEDGSSDPDIDDILEGVEN